MWHQQLHTKCSTCWITVKGLLFASHYNQRLVYFKPTFEVKKRFLRGFFCQILALWAGYNGARTVLYMFQEQMQLQKDSNKILCHAHWLFHVRKMHLFLTAYCNCEAFANMKQAGKKPQTQNLLFVLLDLLAQYI